MAKDDNKKPAGDVRFIKPPNVLKQKVGKGGIVSQADDRQEAVIQVTRAAECLGLERAGLIESPITGTDGNQEFLALWRLSRGLSSKD